MSELTIDVSAIEDTADDIRTDTEKTVDAAMGIDVPTSSDTALSRIVSKVDKLLNNVRDTPNYLELGHACSNYVMDLVSKGNYKRSDVITRVTDRCLDVVTLDKASVRPNDWIAVYWLARLLTECETVDLMKKTFIKSVSYRLLLALKFSIDRNDDNTWAFKPGWIDKIRSLAKSTIRGKQLLLAIEEHEKLLADEAERLRRNTLTPLQIETEDRRKAQIESDKQRASLNKMATNVANKATEIGVSPDELRDSLERLGVIPKSARMDLVGLGRNMTHQDAVQFADSLLTSKNTAVIVYLISRLSKAISEERDKMTG